MNNWIPKGFVKYNADKERLIKLNKKREPKVIKGENPDYTHVEQITLF